MKTRSFLLLLTVFLLSGVYGCAKTDSTSVAPLSSTDEKPAIQEKVSEEVSGRAEAEQTHSQTAEEQLALKLFIFGADDYEVPKEIREVKVSARGYRESLTETINSLFSGTELEFRNIQLFEDEKSAAADISSQTADMFDRGSTAGMIFTNEMVMTLLNLPGIEKLKVTVDGKEGQYGNHYNFDGIFVRTETGKFELVNDSK